MLAWNNFSLHILFRSKKKEESILALSDSDDNIKPSKKLPQPTRKDTIFNLNNTIVHITNYFSISAATSEELFDSLVGNSPEKKSIISSSGEDSPIKFTPPKKSNWHF